MELTIVSFCGGGDGIHALYVDGELHKYGDYYHDKIEVWINGFSDGLKYAKVDCTEKVIDLPDGHELIEDTWEMGNPPPNKLSDIKV